MCAFINGGLNDCYIMDDITEHQSYIAIKEEYVVGACFTLSDTAAEWVEDMIFDEAIVLIVGRARAKDMLGSMIDLRALVAECSRSA